MLRASLVFAFVFCLLAPGPLAAGEGGGGLVRSKNGLLLDRATGKPYDGLHTLYYMTGAVQSQTRYRNGLRDGTELRNYESGKLCSRRDFKAGKLNGTEKVYYESGRLKHETPYTDDMIEGLARDYRPDGVLRSQCMSSRGRAEGEGCEYYPAGELKSRSAYRAGLRDGAQTVYGRESGKPVAEVLFSRGQAREWFVFSQSGEKTSVSREEFLRVTEP